MMTESIKPICHLGMCSKTMLLLLSISLFSIHSAQAKVFLSVQEALEQSFPKAEACEVKTVNRYLTAEQMKQAESLSGFPTTSALIIQYSGTCGGKLRGRAYTDTHRVRTHPETLFMLVDSNGVLQKTEVLSFDEPLDYIPKGQWYQTFEKKKLDNDLQIKRAIPFVTGASLTGQATLQSTRRILAIDHILTQVKLSDKK